MGVHISPSEFPNTLSDQGDISEFNSFLFILKKKYEIISIISEISSSHEKNKQVFDYQSCHISVDTVSVILKLHCFPYFSFFSIHYGET